MCQGHMQRGARSEADLTPEQEVGELQMREEGGCESVSGSVSPGLCRRLWEYSGHLV